MLSIFIWKSNSNVDSKTETLKIYNGSTWFLQETAKSVQNSYKYIAREVIESDSVRVMVQHVKEMPSDWVGSDVLDCVELPYQEIKSDAYGSLIKLGTWFRFTLKGVIDFEKPVLESEFRKIVKWINDDEILLSFSRDKKEK